MEHKHAVSWHLPLTWWRAWPVWRGRSWATSSGGCKYTSCSQGAPRWRWRRTARGGGGARCWRGCCRVWPGCRPAWTSSASCQETAGPGLLYRRSPAGLWTWTDGQTDRQQSDWLLGPSQFLLLHNLLKDVLCRLHTDPRCVVMFLDCRRQSC